MSYKSWFIFFAVICIRAWSISSETSIEALASLVFHTQDIATNPLTEDTIVFTQEDLDHLWQMSLIDSDEETNLMIQQAQHAYAQGRSCLNNGQFSEGQNYFKQAHQLLYHQWDHLTDFSCDRILRAHHLPYLDNNQAIPKKIKKRMRPYVIPPHHPMKSNLDLIFQSTRATLNESSFIQAGFTIKFTRPRSFIRVASHPLLPDYLIKANFDSDLRNKYHKPSWEWLIQRCIGADRIRRIIYKKHLKHFTVAKKWLYPLPAEPAPPATPRYQRHLAVLLVTDMHLTTAEENLHAWRHIITKQHLDELYTIISRAKGSSYRPDNIHYTVTGQFAFIDTEYPSNGPDFRSIRPYLRSDMRVYWDRLVKKKH